METILAIFHDVEILLCVIEKLNMSMRALMASVLNCALDLSKKTSEHMKDVFFLLPIDSLTIRVVNAGAMFVF